MALRAAIEAAEEREELERASRTAVPMTDGPAATADELLRSSPRDEASRLRAQLTAQQAKMGELLQGLSAEWELEQGQLQQTIHQLRAQFATAKAAHQRQLRVRGETPEEHDEAECHPDHSPPIPLASLVPQRCLAAELRLEELASVSAREAAELQREAARLARAELRAQMDSQVAQVAASTEADARIVELQEEAAAKEAQVLELRAELAARPKMASASDWQEATAPDGRSYYWNTTSQEVSWTMPAELAQLGACSHTRNKAVVSEAGQEELGDLRAQNSKLQRQLASASARLRAAGSALSEQQQQVADAMSIGTSKCLQAAIHSWVHHLLGAYWRRWSACVPRTNVSPLSGRVSQPTQRVHAIRRWVCTCEAIAATRALHCWREAVRVLAGRRHLQLTRELLGAQQEQWQDGMLLSGAMKLASALATTSLAALPVAFALWRALVIDPGRVPVLNFDGLPAPSTPLLQQHLEAEVTYLNQQARNGASAEQWSALYAHCTVLSAQLNDERARSAQLMRSGKVTRAALATEVASLEARSQGGKCGGSYSQAGMGHARAAAAWEAAAADCERAALRGALSQPGSGTGIGSALPGASLPTSLAATPIVRPQPWELQEELNAVRAVASEMASARASALQSQLVASAAAADVQRASSALGSEVAQLRRQLQEARSAAAREMHQRRTNAVRELRFGGPMDEPGRRAMQCASALVLSHDGAASASGTPLVGLSAQAPRRSNGAAGYAVSSSPRGPLALHSTRVWEAARVR